MGGYGERPSEPWPRVKCSPWASAPPPIMHCLWPVLLLMVLGRLRRARRWDACGANLTRSGRAFNASLATASVLGPTAGALWVATVGASRGWLQGYPCAFCRAINACLATASAQGFVAAAACAIQPDSRAHIHTHTHTASSTYTTE